MDQIIDLILDAAEAYAKSTPRKWDDAVVALLRAFLTNPDFMDALKKAAEKRGVAVAFS